MKNLHNLVGVLALIFAISIPLGLGCKTPKLEAGGVYAPTNEQGVVIYNDVGLAMADTAYKFSYDTILSVLKFEKDNRADIFKLSPTIGLQVKHALDKVRDEVWAIDQKWALARRAYRANPTPAGLTTLQTILAEIQRVVSAVQADITPVYATLGAPAATQ